MKKINYLFFYLAIFLIIIFTQFYHPVNGLADDQIGLVTAEKVIQNITPQEGYKDLTEKYIETGGLHPCSGMGLPWINTVYTLVTHGYSSLVGLSIPKWHFLSVLLFVLLLYLAKKLGDFLFDPYGFILPFLLAVNLYVLVAIRNSIILFSLSMALQFGVIYYFLKAHEKFNLKNFALACLFLFLSLSNGSTYSPVTYLYLIIILFSLFFWKVIHVFKGVPVKDFKFLRKEYYLFLFLGIPLFAIVSYFVNDLFLNVPLGSSLDGFLYFTKSKFGPSEFPTLSDKIANSIFKFKEVFQGTSFREIFGPHVTFFPYQTPVLGKAASLLFFLGILSFFKNFTYKKLVLLSFLIYTSYFIYGVGAARIFIVFVPFLLLIASTGFVFFMNILKAIKLNQFWNRLLLLVLFGLLFYDAYFFENYFVVESNTNLMMLAGVAGIEKYLDSVDDNRVLVFMELGYPTYYLADFKKTDFIINKVTNSEEFRKQIKGLEERYNEVVLIFPTNFNYVGNPGLINGVWPDFNYRYRFFLEAFPERVVADKVIYNYQRIPQHYLYRFSKTKELPEVKRLVIEEASTEVPLDFTGEVQALRIRGGIESLRFSGQEELRLNASPSTEIILNFGQPSSYNFYPGYGDESFKENLHQREEDLPVEERFLVNRSASFTWIEPNLVGDNSPYLLEYFFELPYQVEKAEIKTDMRLFNAEGSRAAIRGYLVDDENHFDDYLEKNSHFSFLEVKSDNSNTYAPGGEANILSNPQWGLGRLSSYAVLEPKAKKFLVALWLKAQYYRPDYFLAHLYNIGRSSFFKFTLDTREVEKIKVSEGTILFLERDEASPEPLRLDIIYQE